jgi:hypothetical protein
LKWITRTPSIKWIPVEGVISSRQFPPLVKHNVPDPTGPETKNKRAGEGQQQFTRLDSANGKEPRKMNVDKTGGR